MFRINLPFGDGYLLLSPRLGSMPRILQVLILVLMLGLLLAFVFWLYRYELRFVSKRWSRTLLAIRLLIVALVFSVVGLKPTLRHVAYQTIPSHVLIAIDRSDSMGITDPQRDPVEKLELARGLRLATDLADDATLSRWMDDLRKLSPPRDEAYRKVIERIDSLPRRSFAIAALVPDGINLLGAIGERHRVQVIGFSQHLAQLPISIDSLQTILSADGKSRAEAFTDLKLPLKHGRELRDELKDGLIGIVVFSDGQHNWGSSPGELAYELGHTEGKPPIPVYTVVCGARVPPPDLAIASVKASPSIVFKHGSANLDIRLQANNIPEGKIKITVEYPHAPELPDRQPIVELIDYDGINQPAQRNIPVKMDRATSERLKVTVEALPKDGSKAEDRFPENNTRDVVINVAPDKAKVLVIDGEARWELHYLQTALLRDETMETKSVVFDQPRLNLVKGDELKEMKLPDLKLPGPDDLPRNDCIILGDVFPDQLPLEDRNRLEKFVADRGGTLVILAGKRSMPMQFLSPGDPIGRMLPITEPRVFDRKEGFLLALTPEGLQTDFLRLEDEIGASEERWHSLPPHYWGVIGKAKPQAVALASISTFEKNESQQRDRAVILRHNYGFGHVVYVGLDSTWRWRFKQGDKYHHKFWSKVIRWAASDRAMIAGNEHVRFGVREPVYRSDQEVEMLVRLSEQIGKLGVDSLKGAQLLRRTKEGTDEPVALTPLRPNPEIPGQFEGKQGNLGPGDYVMELVIPDIDAKLLGPDGKKLRAPFKVLAPETGEMLNLSTNWERMKEIADKSGGAMYSVDQAGELLKKLRERTATSQKTTDKQLWQSWWLLIPLISLLTVEWLIRKWVGLA